MTHDRLQPQERAPAAITFRDLTEDDLDALCEWRNDPAVSRFLAGTGRTRDEAAEWFRRITSQSGNLLQGVVVDGRLVGYCVVEDVNAHVGKCEVGLVLGDPSIWGRGVGKSVIARLLHHAFDEIDMNRVLAVVADGNVRSENLLRSAGFVHEGTLRAATRIAGRHTDLLCYSMLRHEYEGLERSRRPTLPPRSSPGP